MKMFRTHLVFLFAILILVSCNESEKKVTKKEDLKEKTSLTAREILGNSDYLAISYGGYRKIDHNIEPTLDELKDDMRILHAMGIRIVRTYKVHLPHAKNLLRAISELKEADPDFEMYVMLGAWIDCKNAWTDQVPDHNIESERNAEEIEETIRLANKYPDIVKIIAVGNEAMVKWATSYYVQPEVILKWVNHLQELKKSGGLDKDVWITSSDNFASWGGGDPQYHVEDLNKLLKAVDYVSMHTYPMHDTHYNPQFWGAPDDPELTEMQKIELAMIRARDYAKTQFNSVKKYMDSIGVDKPLHIGETGWATSSNGFYGSDGSRATDEYKMALFYDHMREWTNSEGISCFYFEAFDEKWKDAANQGGSENHFGLFKINGEAKYVLWDEVEQGIFEGLTRNGNPITKTYNGNMEELIKDVAMPPLKEMVDLK